MDSAKPEGIQGVYNLPQPQKDIQDFYHGRAAAKIPMADDYGDVVSNDKEMGENVKRLKRSSAAEENKELKRARSLNEEDIQDFCHGCAVAKIPRADDYGDVVSNDKEMGENVKRLERSSAAEENKELKRARSLNEDVRSDCSHFAVDKPVEANDYGCGMSDDKKMEQSNKSLESEEKMATDVTAQVGDVRSDCSHFAVDKPVEANDYGCGMSDDKKMEQSNKSLESEEKMATDVTAQVGEDEADSDDFSEVSVPSDEKLYWWRDPPPEPEKLSRNYSSDSDIDRYACKLPICNMSIQTDDESSNDGFWEQASP